MSIRAIIWDMGGVLVRTENPSPRTLAAERLGLTRSELERMVFAGECSDRATLGEIGSADLWQNVCTQLNQPLEECISLQQAFWGGDQLDNGLVEYIRALRHNYRTALLSNAFLDLRSALERWGIVDAFDELIISAEVGLMKPDPRIFQLALARLKVEPAEAVFIDDFSLNVRAAQAAGLLGIRFLDPLQVRADLQQVLELPKQGSNV
jgi:epoxide hydrolase-like predicted phosphatase